MEARGATEGANKKATIRTINKEQQTRIKKVLPLVGLISTTLSRQVECGSDVELPGALFKDFWFYATIFGLSDSSLGWPSELQNQIANIARFSPVLTFDDNQPVKQSLANHSALKDSNVTSKELEELRTGLLTTIGPKVKVKIC